MDKRGQGDGLRPRVCAAMRREGAIWLHSGATAAFYMDLANTVTNTLVDNLIEKCFIFCHGDIEGFRQKNDDSSSMR